MKKQKEPLLKKKRPKSIDIAFDNLLELAERLSFFDEMKKYQMVKVLRNLEGHVFVYEKDDCIVLEAEKDTELYIILSGDVIVQKGLQEFSAIGKILSGDFFGEISFIMGTPRLATVVANSKTIVLRLSEENFSNLEPMVQIRIKDKILKKLVTRLHTMNESVQKLLEENIAD